jgi:uncharacterized membrane-anchored protein YitT (DUF2179 family)
MPCRILPSPRTARERLLPAVAVGLVVFVQGCTGLIPGKQSATADAPGGDEAFQVTKGRPGVVIGAPPGVSDADTDRVARELASLTGFGLVVMLAASLGLLAIVPFPDVTPDLVLTAVFGGFFIGAGIGLAVRGGAVIDGTEIAALLISKRTDLLRVGDVILAFNVVLFLIAMSILGVDAALYSILTYVAAARTLGFVLYGIDAHMAIIIISDQNVTIRERIMRDLGRGVTIYKGYGGMSGAEQNILYCVVTRLEIGKVKAIVRDLDASAFIVFHALAGAEGGLVKTRGFH